MQKAELAEAISLSRLIDPDWDKLHTFELCEACAKRTWTLGTSEVTSDPEWYIV